MFIYTLKASSIKFFAVVLLSVVVLVTLIAVIPEYGTAGDVAVVSIQYGEVKTNDDRLAFIRQFGYSPVSEPAESAEVIIPETFDAVYEKYNELQRAQGLNLKKYQGKSAMKYTYLLEEYPGYEGRVLFTMLVYKDKGIAGDVCGIDEAQFIHGFERKTPRDASDSSAAESSSAQTE